MNRPNFIALTLARIPRPEGRTGSAASKAYRGPPEPDGTLSHSGCQGPFLYPLDVEKEQDGGVQAAKKRGPRQTGALVERSHRDAGLVALAAPAATPTLAAATAAAASAASRGEQRVVDYEP